MDSFYGRIGKRAFDLAAAILALAVLSPLMLLIAALIRLTSRGPALFVQERLGRNAVTFRVYKYRTMTDRPRAYDTLYFTGDPNDVTLIGRLLRRTKLDELPQLLNVLMGDMSIVGPRPQLAVQLREFDENGMLRLLVRPGITGMAQTHGNVALSWPERWRYDADYVRRVSLKLDLGLIARTVCVVVRGETPVA
ncbi:MAG TPA: sugar transferase [Thermoanaerobaculia bacterium]|nr:sugar transferase [Thermoanaerobaculia bacterium]